MRLSSFTTKNGEEVKLGNLNVLVGPNNVGKSQTLQDVRSHIMERVKTSSTIIEDINIEPESSAEFLKSISLDYDEPENRVYINNLGPELSETLDSYLGTKGLETIKNKDNIYEELDKSQLRSLLSVKISHLDAAARLELVTESNTYTVGEEQPKNVVQKLYDSDEARARLRKAFNEIFDKDVVLDCSSLAKFRLKLSDSFEDIESGVIESGNESRGKNLHEQGAGYRGLAGVVMGILFSKDRIVLLDEPEAFLHPAQSRRFGRWVGKHATKAASQVIISTHNSHFLSGMLGTERGVNIKRLNRSGDTTKYHSIPKKATEKMSSDPLLSTQRVIDGLFHQGVIICEAHTDKAVYSYISNELIGEGDYLFTYAEELQAIPRISDVLYQSSIPTAMIVDVDAPRNPGDLKRLVESVSDDDSTIHNECNELNIHRREKSIKWKKIKKNGIESLDDDLKTEFEKIIEKCEGFGIFVVRSGELESWLELDKSKGSGWVVEALDYLNENGSPEELEEFLKLIHRYLNSRYADLVKPNTA